MARIYDNLETKFTEGLQGIISNVGVKRVDFCVGYFNLRGWNLIVDQIDTLSGDYVYEDDERRFRVCRLLIGMHRPDEELIKSNSQRRRDSAVFLNILLFRFTHTQISYIDCAPK